MRVTLSKRSPRVPIQQQVTPYMGRGNLLRRWRIHIRAFRYLEWQILDGRLGWLSVVRWRIGGKLGDIRRCLYVEVVLPRLPQ